MTVPPLRNGSIAGRVIVTYARSWQALAAIRSLGRRGVEVVAADEYDITPGGLSRYAVDHFHYPSPEADPTGFLEVMSDAVARFRPPRDVPFVLMPMHRETFVLARHRARFEPRIEFPFARTEHLDLARHKRRLIQHAQNQGIPLPRTWMPTTLTELRQLAEGLKYPVFVKLPQAASGVGIQEVEDATTLIESFERLVRDYALSEEDWPLVQETVPGQDYAVTGLFDRGRAGAMLVYRNVLSFPAGHGPGVVRETVSAPRLEAWSQQLLGGLQWHGIAQVDWRWTGDPEDEPRLLEVNPRFFGGLSQAITSGVDYPWLLFRLAVQGTIPAPEPVRIGTRTTAPVLGLLATLQKIAESELRGEELQRSWSEAKQALKLGEGWQAMRALLDGFKESVDLDGRMALAKDLMKRHEESISLLYDPDDPFPVLGMVYPLAVFLRHGKINQELLTGTQERRP